MGVSHSHPQYERYYCRSPPCETPGFCARDLELMHQWSTSTYKTLSEIPELEPFWRDNVVKIGLRCHFVTRGILCVAALHLAHLTAAPERKQEFSQTASYHYDGATRAARESIPDLTKPAAPEDQENHFIFSILNVYYENFADGFLHQSDRDESRVPDLFALSTGSQRLAAGAKWVGNRESLVYPIILHTQEIYDCAKRISTSGCSYIGELESRIQALDSASCSIRASCELAVEELKILVTVFYEFPRSRLFLNTFRWMYTLPEGFMQLLRSPKPPQEVLVIFVYCCMLSKVVSHEWWSERWMRSLTNLSHELLDDEHRAWVVELSGWVS
ncbi:hypothetical protein AJ79_06945 [Helicocarpus griseus UAMH5409]|uniref:Transcription factor domain-containing protein n=1 Tax=Helicocarpus griseus UAMH5409 TaxID=1447875 RepID=A0A2B7X7L0_9EURO|nr:hypothetical protein AJ79_06945 [Helicocarpus griseus UAMH5409]